MKNLLRAAIAILSAFSSVAYAHGSEEHKSSTLPMGLDPAHLHLLTNHIPIFITLAGLITLGLAFLWKNDAVRRAALILLIIGTVGGLVTYWLGQQAYKPVRGLADETGQDWLDLHMERAEKVIWLYWLAAVLATTALVAAWRKSRFALIATILAGALGAATLGVAGWIADAGGKIRHPEIRGDSKPVSEETSSETAADTTNEAAPHEH
jgi:ABC-type branched-subunit amino acid transport system permease subunit